MELDDYRLTVLVSSSKIRVCTPSQVNDGEVEDEDDEDDNDDDDNDGFRCFEALHQLVAQVDQFDCELTSQRVPSPNLGAAIRGVGCKHLLTSWVVAAKSVTTFRQASYNAMD